MLSPHQKEEEEEEVFINKIIKFKNNNETKFMNDSIFNVIFLLDKYIV